jgi:hypothetical protein
LAETGGEGERHCWRGGQRQSATGGCAEGAEEEGDEPAAEEEEES